MLPPPLLYRFGRIAADGFSRRNISEYAAFARHLGPVAELEVADDAGLACDRDAVSNFCTARYASLADNDAKLANTHVVTDLNQVVDHRTRADNGIGTRTSVNCAIGADFHIVFNDHAAQLRHFDGAARRTGETEAVLADADTGEDRNTLTDKAMAERNVGANIGVGADDASRPNDGVCADVASRANNGLLADHGIGADMDPIADFRISRDSCALGNPTCAGIARVKQLRDAGVSKVGLISYQKRHAFWGFVSHFLLDNAGTRGTYRELLNIFFVVEKADVIGCSSRKWRNILKQLFGDPVFDLGIGFSREARQRDGLRYREKARIGHRRQLLGFVTGTFASSLLRRVSTSAVTSISRATNIV